MIRKLLIDWPAAIVDAWFRFYWFLLAAVTMISVTILLIALVLALFGIRWGF